MSSQQQPCYLQPFSIFVSWLLQRSCCANPTYSLAAYPSGSQFPITHQRSCYTTLPIASSLILQNLCCLDLGNGLAVQPLPIALPLIPQHLCFLALGNSLDVHPLPITSTTYITLNNLMTYRFDNISLRYDSCYLLLCHRLRCYSNHALFTIVWSGYLCYPHHTGGNPARYSPSKKYLQDIYQCSRKAKYVDDCRRHSTKMIWNATPSALHTHIAAMIYVSSSVTTLLHD